MQEIKVKNLIIGMQYEDSENYQEFIRVVNEKKIKVNMIEAGKKLNIEKNLYFDILWPNSNNVLTENILNNNSLICKMVYNDFSILFTGDVEETAEEEIVNTYKNIKALQSTVLKIAHHGSKTSSTEEFIEEVKPEIALIGVGQNNLYGHPAEQVMERLEKFRYGYL